MTYARQFCRNTLGDPAVIVNEPLLMHAFVSPALTGIAFSNVVISFRDGQMHLPCKG
jgi:hypothetical protein